MYRRQLNTAASASGWEGKIPAGPKQSRDTLPGLWWTCVATELRSEPTQVAQLLAISSLVNRQHLLPHVCQVVVLLVGCFSGVAGCCLLAAFALAFDTAS